MKLLPFFAVLLVTLADCELITSRRPSVFPIPRNNSGCLTRFHSEPEYFEPCKKTICFLFLSQPPFIILDPKMNHERDQQLFPCKARRKAFDDLSGIAFKIHQEMDLDDALCVWAGDTCSFNNMVDFVAEHARANETREYQFAITGILTLLPRRISMYAFPTISFLDSQVDVLSLKDHGEGLVKTSFRQVFRAFKWQTWAILVMCITALLCLMFIISAVFSTPSTPLNILMNMLGERREGIGAVSPLTFRGDNVEDSADMQKLVMLHRAAKMILSVAFSAFCIITLLFYELSAVNFIFHEKSHKLEEVRLLSDKELALYAVPKSSALESVWRRAVDPTRMRFLNHSKVPWYRCRDSNECFDRMLNPSDPIRYSVDLRAAVKYQLRTRKECDNVVKYDTVRPLHSFGGAWFMGRSVPHELRVKIDQELLRMKLTNDLNEILEKQTENPYEGCGSDSGDIGPDMIAFPLLFIVGPCVLVSVVFLSFGCCMRIRIRRKNKFDISDRIVDFRDGMHVDGACICRRDYFT